MVNRSGREVRALVGEGLAPADLESDGAVRERWGAGRYVLAPRTTAGRLAGPEVVVTVAHEDGTIPPFAAEDAPDTGAPSAAAAGGLAELVAEMRSARTDAERARAEHQREMLGVFRELLGQSRADRAGDIQLFTSLLESTRQTSGDAQTAGRLAELEARLEAERTARHELELRRARERSGESDGEFLGVLAHQVMERLGGAPAAPAAPAAPVVRALPDPSVLASALASGAELDDASIALLVRAVRSGDAPASLVNVVRQYIAREALGEPAGAPPGAS